MPADARTGPPAWSYVPLGLLGVGIGLWRAGAFEQLPAPAAAPLIAESPLAVAGEAPQYGPDGAGAGNGTVVNPPAEAEAESPVALEDPLLSNDPDVRAEAAALRTAIDSELASTD
jgi:hypothetical protein